MDYPLGEYSRKLGLFHLQSLNPYSNGLPSRGLLVGTQIALWVGLNPYSNGLPSRGGEYMTQAQALD